MKKVLFLFLILIALLLASISLHAGELVFHWNTMAESKIYDMEFMPDNDYFVIVTANEFQVRRTEDGEIFKTYPKTQTYEDQDIEFSPDSTKLFLSYGEVIEIRSVEDFSIIQTYTMPPAGEGYSPSFLEIKVDPKKPYIYALERQWWVGTPGEGAGRDGIFVYNYETMEKVADITPAGFDRKVYEHIAISSDGKYLSFINQGESYLITIDLATQKELQRFRICKNYSDGGGSGGWPVCIKFSELDSDKIYFSGTFPQSIQGTYFYYGLFIYSLSENKIIDSTFGVGNDKILNSYFSLFDNDKKAIAANSLYVYITDFEKNIIENKINLAENIPFSDKILFNKSNNYFIGYAYSLIGKIEYNINSYILEKPIISDIIYPNPTTNEIIINKHCEYPTMKYKIINTWGQILSDTTINNYDNKFVLNLTSYSPGTYILQVNCNNEISTYKVIKEN